MMLMMMIAHAAHAGTTSLANNVVFIAPCTWRTNMNAAILSTEQQLTSTDENTTEQYGTEAETYS
jgi:hypothetical protein